MPVFGKSGVPFIMCVEVSQRNDDDDDFDVETGRTRAEGSGHGYIRQGYLIYVQLYGMATACIQYSCIYIRRAGPVNKIHCYY